MLYIARGIEDDHYWVVQELDGTLVETPWRVEREAGSYRLSHADDSRETARVSATLENEAIATVENEATQTDWMSDLGGGLGVDQAARGGRCSAAAGREGIRDRPGDGRSGVGIG